MPILAIFFFLPILTGVVQDATSQIVHAATGDALSDVRQLLRQWEEDDAYLRQLEEEDALWRDYGGDDEFFSELPAGVNAGGEAQQSAFLTVWIDGHALELKDVGFKEWFAPYVQLLVEGNLASGYRDTYGNLTGYFGPADDVTVAQLAKVAVQAAGIDAEACAKSTNPTASGSWAVSYVGCAESEGWALYSEKTVDINRPALRGEVVVTVLQALKITPEERTGDVFADIDASVPFAQFIEQAGRDGIVSGYRDALGSLTGTFGPLNNVNRAEFAKIVINAIEEYDQVSEE